jgi:hypothetical protein
MDPRPKINAKVMFNNMAIAGAFDAIMFLASNPTPEKPNEYSGGVMFMGAPTDAVIMLTALFKKMPEMQTAAIRAICNLRSN